MTEKPAGGGPAAPTAVSPERPETAHWRSGLDLGVAVAAIALTVAFLVAALLFTDQVRVGASHIYTFIAEQFGWVYVLSTAAFVLFILFIGFSRYGRIRIGSADSRPEYSTFSWISMMFALGVGIGLIFYGAAEPALLYTAPPPGGPAPRTDEAAIVAMQYSLFHWGLHVWAFFGVAGLALAYAVHNKHRPSLVTSTLRPFGVRTETTVGRTIDTWVIVTTLVGNAVTLGLGTLQIVAGLGFVAGVQRATWVLVVVVGVLTVGFLFSAVAGVDRGIKRLADFNSLLAIALLVYVFVLGPIAFILKLMFEAVGGYLFNFIPMAFETGAFDEGTWMQNWTVFFWAWGISWAPYVGSFLAKISHGRTIKEYVLGVLVAPTVATVVWFAVIGGTALHLQLTGRRDVSAAAAESPQAALFTVLEEFPASTVTSVAVIVLAAVFFVSGADAGAMVLGTFASKGDPDPHKWLVLVFGALIGLVALALLVIGGLDALQWGAIVAASPFVLILVAMCVGFWLDVRRDVRADPALAPHRARGRA